MKKKVLILTLNNYILYQPSILNLYEALAPHFDVEVFSMTDNPKNIPSIPGKNVTFLAPNYWLKQFYEKKDFIISRFTKYIKKFVPDYIYYYSYYNKYLPSILERHLKKKKVKADIVIAVDLQVLYLAQKIYGDVHFLSLEIDNNTNPYYKKIDPDKIKSVFVQSKLRFDYLFPDKKPKVFYVQNAPSYSGRRFPVDGRRDFVWSGAVDKRLAILECLDFFRAYPEYKMVIKGSANPKLLRHIEEEYQDLIKNGTIVFNREYLESNRFIEFLSGFKMGFCFYQWDLIRASYNYLTAPSGKLFMNFAAGVPVVACNIPGFELVKEFNAGVLVDDYEPETLYKAARQIEANYAEYSEGCYRAAEHFSFDKNVAPYVEFLRKEAGFNL